MKIELRKTEYNETLVNVYDKNEKLIITKTVSDDYAELKRDYEVNHGFIVDGEDQESCYLIEPA